MDHKETDGVKAGPHSKRPPFQRRIFLIKHRFQMLFVLYPLLFFTVFLLGSSYYLYSYIGDTLDYFMYLPHCRLDNMWPEITPGIINVVAVGGSSFLVFLGLWLWRKYHNLKTDIGKLEEWTAGFDAETGAALHDSLKEKEIRLLSRRLSEASQRFGQWEGEVEKRRAEFLESARKLEKADDAEFITLLADLRDKWRKLWDEVNHVRIDERLS